MTNNVKICEQLGLALLILGLAFTPWAAAGEVNLTWDPSAGATGYKLYSGNSSGSLGTPTDVGNSVQAQRTGMTDCAATYFAVTAYNSAGESGFSNEIATWPRPALAAASPSQGQRGDRLDLVVSGLNFEPGSTVQFSNPAITVNSVSVDACGQITADITIGGSAAFGSIDVSVTNTTGVTGVAPGLFIVATGSPLPDVQNLRRTDTK